ncbi:unnamed protein product [Dracunculus medinensis]|uniref:TAFII28 domain-containing protein n=1 Tax=Dracunculus medinensis TaxID=318479 RepID=A0A0N4U0Y7_DRAME|nr:unnamed protein product [Dracunculus medinensis]
MIFFDFIVLQFPVVILSMKNRDAIINLSNIKQNIMKKLENSDKFTNDNERFIKSITENDAIINPSNVKLHDDRNEKLYDDYALTMSSEPVYKLSLLTSNRDIETKHDRKGDNVRRKSEGKTGDSDLEEFLIRQRRIKFYKVIRYIQRRNQSTISLEIISKMSPNGLTFVISQLHNLIEASDHAHIYAVEK